MPSGDRRTGNSQVGLIRLRGRPEGPFTFMSPNREIPVMKGEDHLFNVGDQVMLLGLPRNSELDRFDGIVTTVKHVIRKRRSRHVWYVVEVDGLEWELREEYLNKPFSQEIVDGLRLRARR